MIQPTSQLDLPVEDSTPGADAPPWDRPGEIAGLAIATLWATGPDPRRDGVFRMQATRRVPDSGEWESFDATCDPFAGVRGAAASAEARPAATARMVREFGVTAAELEGAPPARALAEELGEFLRGRTVIVPASRGFRNWILALTGSEALTCRLLDPAGVAALLLPGRLAAEGELLTARLLAGDGPVARARALAPEDVRRALSTLVSRILASDEATLAILAHGYREAWEALRASDPEAALELAAVLRLCEHPSRWREPESALFPVSAPDGCLTDAVRAYPDLGEALGRARPVWAHPRATAGDHGSLPPFQEDEEPLDDDDRRRVDEGFQEHLPRALEERRQADKRSYRAGQHQLAARIAAGFGSRELTLLHAPTGTGKTLAYLVPGLLWALRNGVRVGVATFTRALQEQAMEREVPLALDVLKRAGVTARLRVSVLKGRTNYVCWRALKQQAPGPDDAAAERLAWTALTLFALGPNDGDLDQLARGAPLRTLRGEGWRRALDRLLRLTHSETGCCSFEQDRTTCGAEAARRRAERSHLVITNHAFALARREFFRHLVFDECEHLHDVAHDAFSHAVSLRALRDLLERFGGAGGRRPLARAAALSSAGSGTRRSVQTCVTAQADALEALLDVDEALLAFKHWRTARARSRKDGDGHSLFREFFQGADSSALLSAHGSLMSALGTLSGELAGLAEHLDADLPRREVPRLRRSLEVLRIELDERLVAIGAWLPRDEAGQPAFRRETFYDLEAAPNGDDVPVARVLLPHEYLGRHYYAELRSAVLLSATTWLRGGFETARTYLGLERAAEPAEDEERPASTVTVFRAPEPFDYRRVLVAVPRDSPSVRDKDAYLTYAARFVGYLAERTRGRMLVLFTNGEDLVRTGTALEPFFAARHLPLWYQRMRGSSKEELSELFRAQTDSVLLGLDTFWYGADFPGETLEYLVVARLPYGVPDRYHHAQCSVLGHAEQRRQIYLPRALAKFRQGFGRLMRKETDRGCVFFLDHRILDPRHRVFLKELPVESPVEPDPAERSARLVLGDTQRCLDEALGHMGMKADLRRRGLDETFAGWSLTGEQRPDEPPWQD